VGAGAEAASKFLPGAGAGAAIKMMRLRNTVKKNYDKLINNYL
jgi:hypothetical protein